MSLKNRKLGRTSDHRKAMLRAMVTYLLENGQIKTTLTRAKEVAPVAEKMITLAKDNTLVSYRQALGFINKEDVANKPQQVRRAQAVHRDRRADGAARRRLHPHRPHRAPPRRRRRDGYHPAGVIPRFKTRSQGNGFFLIS